MKTEIVSIVSENQAICELLARLLNDGGVASAAFASAASFLAASDQSLCPCAIVDARLPDVSALKLLKTLLFRVSGPSVILVMVAPDIRLAVRAMSLGALTVLQKPLNEQELWDAIGEARAIAAQRHMQVARLHATRRRMTLLTKSELDVLEMILAGKMNKAIASELHSGLRTVEARRHSIMAKLAVRSVAELATLVWEVQAAGRLLESPAWQRLPDSDLPEIASREMPRSRRDCCFA